MNVVIHQSITVLQILTFRDTVGRNQDVDIGCIEFQSRLILGNGREAGEHIVKVRFEFWNGRSTVYRAGNKRSMQTVSFEHKVANVIVEIRGCIGERGEDDEFAVAGIDRMLDLIGDGLQQKLELGIVCRCNILYHTKERVKRVEILTQIVLPCDIVHIRQCNFYFFTNGEQVELLIVTVEVNGVG